MIRELEVNGQSSMVNDRLPRGETTGVNALLAVTRITSFEDLDVWKACRELRRSVFDLTTTFPTEKRFRLTDQIRRAAMSGTANIAEGYGRYHYQEKIQFCRQSRGSL